MRLVCVYSIFFSRMSHTTFHRINIKLNSDDSVVVFFSSWFYIWIFLFIALQWFFILIAVYIILIWNLQMKLNSIYSAFRQFILYVTNGKKNGPHNNFELNEKKINEIVLCVSFFLLAIHW